MDLSREEALSILGLGPSATDEEAVRAYTRRKQPLKRKLVRAASVDLKNEYRGRLRALVRARDVALGRPALDDRTREVELAERALLASLQYDTLDRAQALAVLGLREDATDAAIQTAHAERYRFLTQRLGWARDDQRLAWLRTARVRLLGVRRFLLDRTETLDLTAVFEGDFEEEDEPGNGPEIEAGPEVRAEPFFDDENGRRGGDDALAETLGDPNAFDFDPEQTRTSLAPEWPDPDDWDGDAEAIRATYERLARPLRERMAAAGSEELRVAYERAIAELGRKRDETLRLRGERAD